MKSPKDERSERVDAICNLVRFACMQDEQIDITIHTFAKQAELLGKSRKNPDSLASIKERIKSKDFIEQFVGLFDKLSTQEIIQLANIFNSEVMRKYSQVSINLTPIYRAIQELI